jgi:hypothetical protein
VRRRACFAKELQSVVALIRTKWCNVHSPVPLQRIAIFAAEEELLMLAAALRSPAQISSRSAGIVSFLLRDGASPLYSDDTCPVGLSYGAGPLATPAQLSRAALAGFRDP